MTASHPSASLLRRQLPLPLVPLPALRRRVAAARLGNYSSKKLDLPHQRNDVMPSPF